MTTITIQGDPRNITTDSLSYTIVSAVSGGGVVTCTTSAAHLFGQNDAVQIAGATGMTGLNAIWPEVTVTGSTTFTIPTTLSGTYGASSATVTDLSLTPPFAAPLDGTGQSMQVSGLLSALKALADRVEYVHRGGIRGIQNGQWLTGSVLTIFGGLNIYGTGALENGASFFFLSGSQLNFSSGSTITGSVEFNNVSITTFDAGAFLGLNSGTTFKFSSANTAIQDNAPIPFATPVSRTIAQPLNLRGTPTSMAAVATMGKNAWGDAVAGGDSWYMSFDKLVNGATLDTVIVPFDTLSSSPGSGANNQQVSLWRTNLLTGVDTQIGTTKTIPNGLATSTHNVSSIAWTSLGEVINDSASSYSVQVVSATGGSANPVIWYPPICTFDNITSLRSI